EVARGAPRPRGAQRLRPPRRAPADLPRQGGSRGACAYRRTPDVRPRVGAGLDRDRGAPRRHLVSRAGARPRESRGRLLRAGRGFADRRRGGGGGARRPGRRAPAGRVRGGSDRGRGGAARRPPVIRDRRRSTAARAGAARGAAGAADALLRREAHLRFDLEDGPLLRLRLARTGEDEHRLIRIHHHIISDAWSWRIFLLELGAFYAAERRGVPAPLAADLPLQYGDYAAWERRCLQPAARRYRDEVGWWRRAAQDGPAPMTLPFARPSAVGDADPADGVSWFGLEPAVSRRLDAIGREVGATYFMLRLAVFAAVLSAESSQRDLIVGTYVT